jgi:mono/diheme cytochrome c family protein
MQVRWVPFFLACWAVAVASTTVSTAPESAAQAPRPPGTAAPPRAFIDSYCVTCHNGRLKTGGLALDALDLANVAPHAEQWEKVVVKLRAGLMPPAGMPRPQQAIIDDFTSALESSLDQAAATNPNPGRTEPFHRLNRAEYQNAIRDLLALDVDATNWLPTDEISYGFDNIAGVLKLSPLLTERYLNTAQKVARLALGTPAPANGDLFRVPDQLDQDVRLEGMPSALAAESSSSTSPHETATTTSRRASDAASIPISRTSSVSRISRSASMASACTCSHCRTRQASRSTSNGRLPGHQAPRRCVNGKSTPTAIRFPTKRLWPGDTSMTTG